MVIFSRGPLSDFTYQSSEVFHSIVVLFDACSLSFTLQNDVCLHYIFRRSVPTFLAFTNTHHSFTSPSLILLVLSRQVQQLSLGASFQRQELDLDLPELLGEGGDKDGEKIRCVFCNFLSDVFPVKPFLSWRFG